MSKFAKDGYLEKQAFLARTDDRQAQVARSNRRKGMGLKAVDALIPIAKAIRRFPRLGSPRHALHVITANLGSPKEALEAGCDIEWLPLALQFDKDKEEKL